MIDLLRQRRSIRNFTPEKLAPDTIDALMEAALRAPSSRGINPWEFILVDDPGLIEKLAQAKQHGAGFLKKAPLAIVVCADSTKSDVWIEDCAIAAIIIQLMAVSLGLGSCWAQVRNRQHDDQKNAEVYVQELLGLPEQIKVECILGIGHPDEKKSPVAADIWRRIQVPSTSTFWDLHVAIQDAMGWQDYHLHEFQIKDLSGKKLFVGIPSDEDDFYLPKMYRGKRNSPPEDCGGTPGYENMLEVLVGRGRITS